ncbi:unnamed protein product [Natator depressus]
MVKAMVAAAPQEEQESQARGDELQVPPTCQHQLSTLTPYPRCCDASSAGLCSVHGTGPAPCMLTTCLLSSENNPQHSGAPLEGEIRHSQRRCSCVPRPGCRGLETLSRAGGFQLLDNDCVSLCRGRVRGK